MSKHNNKNLKVTPEFIEFKNRFIDDFINRLSVSASYYKISIETVYEQKKDILDIYSWYDGFAVHTRVMVSFIMHNNLALLIILEEILHEFTKAFEEFEEIENKQKEETVIYEHWDFIELGSM